MPRRRNVVYLWTNLLPTNQEISQALVERYQKLITGTSFKMKARYSFSDEDAADLRAHAGLKIFAVDWHSKMKRNRDWIRKFHPRPHPQARWTMPEIFKLNGGYASRLIHNSMIDEARRIASSGLSGLDWRHRLEDFPFHNDAEEVELPIETTEDNCAAQEMAELAQRILEPELWNLVSLQFGMDGGGARTPEQVARLVGQPREQVRNQLKKAMEQLRAYVGACEVDGGEPGIG